MIILLLLLSSYILSASYRLHDVVIDHSITTINHCEYSRCPNTLIAQHNKLTATLTSSMWLFNPVVTLPDGWITILFIMRLCRLQHRPALLLLIKFLMCLHGRTNPFSWWWGGGRALPTSYRHKALLEIFHMVQTFIIKGTREIQKGSYPLVCGQAQTPDTE